MSNTHYAVIAFSGDPAGEHPDEDLRGQAPSLTFIASGPQLFCWRALVQWTTDHPLRQWEEAEVLARDPEIVRDQELAAATYRASLPSTNSQKDS
jgi:hypothetical protein